MIEPTGPREAPVHDRYTTLAEKAWSERLEGPRYRGVHTCVCGERSDNVQWVVRGRVTNSLLVHYVRDHRSQVPTEELEKLRVFDK